MKKTVPWEEGEKTYYQLISLGMTAADISFEVFNNSIVLGKDVWHFKFKAKTHGLFKKIHNLEICSDSFIDSETLNTVEWKSDSIEGKDVRHCIERHLPEENKFFVFRELNGDVLIKETREIKHPSWFTDIFSLFYCFRILSKDEDLYIMKNHECSPVHIQSIKIETIFINKVKYECEKINFKFHGREHCIWREINKKCRIIKGTFSTSIANGTLIMKP